MKRTSYRSAAAESHLDQPGFTLVELLVVIGIIAVLIGVLLPVLGKARQSGNRLKCMANLRSLGQAVAIYTNYNKGSLPIGLVNDGNDIDASPYTYHGRAAIGPRCSSRS